MEEYIKLQDMKHTLTLLFAALLLTVSTAAPAQILKAGKSAPSGSVVYSLPVTSITFQVDAVREDFIAGPSAGSARSPR